MNNRTLGIIALVFSPCLQLMGMVGFSKAPWAESVSAGFGLLFLVGWACSATALRHNRLTGSGRGAQVLYTAQLTLFALASMQQVFDMTVGRQQHLVYFVADMAWPGSMALMLIAGVAVLRTRMWAGWRRFVPLACALFLPVFFALVPVLGRDVAASIAGWYTVGAWGLLAYAVLSTPEPKLVPALVPAK
ncbi:hypothetical protein [Solirubrum puertoriconensis]|uniref:Uncharacterized protein n=1 Tax=Solirubrum puertoriconensis TaxID=1751427 RepID=A0A9X0HLU5_SOLP1|nr:hypothetical protein [Solirubrum puertoriconensis]KUG08303.1 hypothetical protein ASU33_09010 [Solirubrum puertoriconensis]